MADALGTMTFLRPDGRTMSIEVEIQDAVDDLATFDTGAGAASGSDYFTHGEELRLVHISMLGITSATACRLIVDGVATRHKFQHNVDYLFSNLSKPPINISIPAGSKVQIIGK